MKTLMLNVMTGKMISISEYFENCYKSLFENNEEVTKSFAERWIIEDSDYVLAYEDGTRAPAEDVRECDDYIDEFNFYMENVRDKLSYNE